MIGGVKYQLLIATVNISNSYEKSTEPEALAVKMLTEKGRLVILYFSLRNS